MRYFTFTDRDSFHHPQIKLWETVLDVRAWPKAWRHVISVNIQTEGAVRRSSKIECFFTLFHLIHLRFEVHILCLKEPYYASFKIEGDFSGQGRWILQEKDLRTDSIFYLHLQSHHRVLRLIAFLPYGKRLIAYSHKRVMLAGKKMILQKVPDA